ncbi:MAG TPA: hypothetical protein VMB21_12865 [Candidatus Limnocylindria bacterium]|jgi:hypothetical protein|nr:hypothetical protein [Candidatus Limnocylindria bacterium]
MKNDPLKAFVSLRESLLKRKATLEAELAQIDKVLSISPKAATAAAPKAAASVTGTGRPKRAKNELSLKEAVLSVVKGKSMSKPDILDAIAKIGYKFTAKSPMNSLNTLLYSDKAFKNTDGKFGAA